MSESYNWSRKSIEELETFVDERVEQAMWRENRDPAEEVPSYSWFVDQGWSGIAYALREHHEMTLKEFLTDVCDLGAASMADGSASYCWGTEHEETVEALESYLRVLDTRGGRAENTISSTRSRLAVYVRAYVDRHSRHNLLEEVHDMDDRPAAIDRALTTLDILDDKLGTDASKLTYLQSVRSWYDHLVDTGQARFNPLAGAENIFDKWEHDEPDNAALAAADVRKLVEVATTIEEELLVVALCGWGLRPSEVARLHLSQFALGGSDPHIAFDGEQSRKNGPGTVSLLFGVYIVESHIDNMTERSSWNGYLFPSQRAESGHIHADTVRRRFVSLAERAGVTVRGETPTPKHGRRFWYTAYQDAVMKIVEQTAGIASDQGSASAKVVIDNYLSEAKRRELRRKAMREQLQQAFG